MRILARLIQSDFFQQLVRGARVEPPVSIAVPRALKQAADREGADHSHPLPPIETLCAEAKLLLDRAGATALSKRMTLRWNVRLRNTAGMAFPSRSLVTLNPRLAEFGMAEIDRTLRHELAHLLAHERAGRRRIAPHGVEWKAACRALGLPDEKRTHDLPLPRHTVRPRYFYRCPGCGFVLPRVRPMRRHSACVKCCRAHAQGRYDARFLFTRIEEPPASY